MNFKGLLEKKNVSGYALAKNTGIPYTTINDLINGRTIIQNVSLKHALVISDYLNIDIRKLNGLSTTEQIDFRYFRNNLLSALKREQPDIFVKKIIAKKEIDYYYKSNAKEYAFYLLALIDYLCRISNKPVYSERYNSLRKERLQQPFFVGSKLFKFGSIKEAEDKLKITVIPEFKKFNIIEEDIFNVA